MTCQASSGADVESIKRDSTPALQPCPPTPPVRTFSTASRARRARRAGWRCACRSGTPRGRCPECGASTGRSWLTRCRPCPLPAAGPAALRPCRATAAPGSRGVRGDCSHGHSAVGPAMTRRCKSRHPSGALIVKDAAGLVLVLLANTSTWVLNTLTGPTGVARSGDISRWPERHARAIRWVSYGH